MKLYTRYIVIFLLSLLPGFANAGAPMADKFRQDGKIYVVVSVAAVILTGIFVYLFVLDKKVSKIEKQIKK